MKTKIRSGIQKELALISGIAAIATALAGKQKSATALGLAATGLYLHSKSNLKTYRDQSILITGGSRGLGFALADEFLSGRAKVTLVARDPEELLRAEAKLRFKHPEARIHKIVADMTLYEDIERTLKNVSRHFGSIDLLVNNAGMISVAPFQAMCIGDFRESMELHLFAIVNATKLVLPYFKGKNTGQIVNICSVGGMVPVPHMSAYDASKFALSGFSQAVTSELAQNGVNITTVYPSVMRTGSPGHALFKGDVEKEFLWFQTLDNLPYFSLDATVAAKKIVAAARREDRILVLSGLAKVRSIAATLFPELMGAIMEFGAKLLPEGISEELKTGDESRALFDETLWTEPFRETARLAEVNYNEVPNGSSTR